MQLAKRILAALLVGVFVAGVVIYWREADVLYAAWSPLRPPETFWAPWLWYHLRVDWLWRVVAFLAPGTLFPAAFILWPRERCR